MPPNLITPVTISFEAGDRLLDWHGAVAAVRAGHERGPARISDQFLTRGRDTFLNRSAWIDGLGMAVKTVTVFPDNPTRGVPPVNGGLCLYDDLTGQLMAVVDFHLVTKWKTVADSLLGATLLAPSDPKTLLICGAGSVARDLADGYRAFYPGINVTVWGRNPDKAADFAAGIDAVAIPDLQVAMAGADIITCATQAHAPFLRGDWLRPGQYVDLIGAFKADMREADDTALRRAKLFVDNRDTVLDHIGEMKIPLAEGVITRNDIRADLYDLCAAGAAVTPRAADAITLFKNGGGAHLDLMIAAYVLARFTAQNAD